MFLVDRIKLLNMEELRTKEVTSQFPRTLPPLSFPRGPVEGYEWDLSCSNISSSRDQVLECKLWEFPSWNPVVQTPMGARKKTQWIWKGVGSGASVFQSWTLLWPGWGLSNTGGDTEKRPVWGVRWMGSTYFYFLKNIYWPDPGFYQHPFNGHQAENQSPLDPFLSIV